MVNVTCLGVANVTFWCLGVVNVTFWCLKGCG